MRARSGHPTEYRLPENIPSSVINYTETKALHPHPHALVYKVYTETTEKNLSQFTEPKEVSHQGRMDPIVIRDVLFYNMLISITNDTQRVRTVVDLQT